MVLWRQWSGGRLLTCFEQGYWLSSNAVVWSQEWNQGHPSLVKSEGHANVAWFPHWPFGRVCHLQSSHIRCLDLYTIGQRVTKTANYNAWSHIDAPSVMDLCTLCASESRNSPCRCRPHALRPMTDHELRCISLNWGNLEDRAMVIARSPWRHIYLH